MIDREYKNYFRKDDYDEVDYYVKKQLKRKILIFSIIGVFLGLIITFNILAFTLDNPYRGDKNVLQNDFTEIDKLIESGKNFNNTPYFP